MSSMTQARLAPITQRYLSMSMRRQDVLDKSKPLSAGQDYAHNDGRQFGRVYQFLANRYDNKVSKSCSQLLLNINDSETTLRKETNTPTSRIKDALNLMNAYSGSNLTLNMPENSPKMIHKPSDMSSISSGISSSVPRPPDGCSEVNHHHHLHHHHWNSKSGRSRGKSDNRDSRRRRYLKPLALLGVLGMFGKPNSNELEEERASLTDEQKMKKMKPIEITIARGVLSMSDQDYDRANQLFHEALHMAQDDNDEERENLLLNLIAANYFESGDYQKAEKLFIELIKQMIAHEVASTAPPVLELSLKLASIYSKNLNTHEKAMAGFKFVITSLLHNLADIVDNLEELDINDISDEKKDELALLGWGYDWFAKHLLNLNDYRGAADLLQKAFQISSLVLGPLHDQTLILLNDIGTTLAMNDLPEEGQTFIKKAVEGAITNQSKELASFYVNLGLVNLKLRKYHDAKRFCENSIELAKKNRNNYNSQEIIELSRTCLNEVQRFLDAEG